MKSMNQIVCENLKNLKEISGLSQDEISKAIGVNRSAYSNYEAGTREMPYDVLEKTAALFGCEPALLFEDNATAQNEIMACAFRVDDLTEEDVQEIMRFKDIVKNYLKMERIASHETK